MSAENNAGRSVTLISHPSCMVSQTTDLYDKNEGCVIYNIWKFVVYCYKDIYSVCPLYYT